MLEEGKVPSNERPTKMARMSTSSAIPSYPTTPMNDQAKTPNSNAAQVSPQETPQPTSTPVAAASPNLETDIEPSHFPLPLAFAKQMEVDAPNDNASPDPNGGDEHENRSSKNVDDSPIDPSTGELHSLAQQ